MGDWEDDRAVWMSDWVLNSTKMKIDKWKKMVSVEENKTMIQEFFDKRENRKLIFLVDAKDQLVPEIEFPRALKKKAVYFFKPEEMQVTKENVKNLIRGDLSSTPIDLLSALVDGVFLPLLSSNANNGGWPKVVSEDVVLHAQELKSSTHVVMGQVKGQTLLPMPVGSEELEGSQETVVSKALVHAIESAVIEWAHQVRDVLKKDSAQPLIEGLNPGALVELDFWGAKKANLTCISEQLNSPQMLRMRRILEDHNSSYAPALQKLYRDVQDAFDEATDITKHLAPLRSFLEDIEEGEFANFPIVFMQLLKILSLVWKHSKHYCTPRHAVVILREIFNQLIGSIQRFIEPQAIFKMEAREALEKLKTALSVCDKVRATFAEFRNKVKEETPEKPWDFETDLVFARFSLYEERLKMLNAIFQTADDFSKLEKVELSNDKLSQQIKKLFEQQGELYTQWGKKTGDEGGYDCLNPTVTQFRADYDAYMSSAQDIDRRLGTIACQAFDDAAGLEGAFKLIFGFQGLLDRPTVALEFAPKYLALLARLDQEIETVKQIFDEFKQSPRVGKNMPTTAGSLKGAKELRDRIALALRDFANLKKPVFETPEALRVFQKCQEMMDLLARYEGAVYEAWTRDVGAKSEVNLNLPLLQRDADTKLVRVNFDPQLVAVLREVKYLEMTKSTGEIPESAAAIFSRNESFRQEIGNLSIAATEYNRVRQTILPVEAPLIAAEMTSIDATLERAISQLNWNSPEAAEYCLATKNLVEDLSGRVQKAKANIDEILAILAKWYDAPLLVRDVKTGLLNYDEKDKLMAAALEAIRTGGEKFHKLIDDNLALFKADAASSTWHAYVDYVDSMVVDGLYNTIHVSLSYLLDNTDAKPVDESQVRPLLEGKMALVPPDIRFDPAMVEGTTLTVHQQISQITADFFSVGSRVARLAKHRGSEDYRADLEGMAELVDLKEELLGKVNAAVDKILGFEQTLLDDYQHLWLDDRAEFMRQFLLYNHVLTQEDIEQYGDEPIPESPPTLEQFKQSIDKYNGIADNVSKIKDNILFDQWFRLDVRGFKTSLHATVKKWSFMFLKHLTEHVTNTLNELASFIQDASVGLKTEITEGNYDKLVYVMGFLNAVTTRAEATDKCFGPLNDTVQLLRTYDVDMPDAVHQLLSNLPAKWSDMKKLAENVGHSVAPVQADEVSKLKRRSNQFDVRNFEFREDFLKRAPLRYDSDHPYERIDKHFLEYLEMENEMNALQKAADLFMVKLPEYKQLKACRKELALLKQVWDMIFLVRSQFEEWEQTNWQQVNVESMEMECKKLVAEIRALDKESRAWEAFNGIDSKVKNMITSLSAVGMLQSPAIRDRHWQQVMNTTGVKIEMSDKTTLADLLALNLHEFEDDVAGIVDRANKEQGMEKMLTQLEATWSAMNFEYDIHGETKTPMLKASEELIETLEENQVQLQNLLTSKYIAYFLEAVSGWQKKLSTADSVIEIWFEVQRTWSHLQSIFIGSEDIRNQLPEDSKRFDTIDHDFKEIMRSAKETPNVVQATNKQGLFDLLEDLQARLALCEKALQEYLETKRLAFPRFYFISPSDLLDILSNGNQPTKVAKQLDKLFQMLCDLKMAEGSDKEAIGMYALDGEYVPFTKPCICEGRVEVWLMNVLVTMIATIREIMTESVVAYEEKPRSEWVFDYPAQVSLVGTQIWWATEVNIAFGRLEEGYENAMKEYNKKQISHLNDLITLLQGKLSGAHRVMLQTICTVDVHSRDVVQNLIATKAENAEAFAWISQLRHMWDEKAKHCRIAICDARFTYCYEYLGNVPRLVITPLTDRCYITLTQSLHLIMSGAPAGPAGTGKTETTKDLARNLGIMTYVFNCSEQMDYKSVGNIYKGLAQSGAWGCFDEFNRISVEVLSVVAVQVKTIQDAVRAKKKRFNFLGEEISLDPTVGIFITMNPGYAGRTELPENIKALFRPCAMVVPDYGQICEIMLVSEGFLNAKLLARKFITLYTLNRDLLSKQDHYDWGLRAIKSVLVVAGSLKRADPDRNEDEVLMRALRDFNIPKIVTEDLPVFMGLIFDLFPGLNVPRKRDMEFEKTVRQAVLELKLQAEDSFVLKVVQLQELLDVRHSVFVLGAAGGGKSCILKSLNKTYALQKRKPVWSDLNPKAVTTNELYGYSNVTTREWVDGLFSSIMRDISKLSNDSPKWMVLDGDIDTLWVESLNTVMDDNKVLTLASNERITLKPSMRLLFEIANLTYASPATVSRAGILFVNPSDLGWSPFVTSWIESLESPGQKANLMILFEKYVPPCLDATRNRFKMITPVSEWSMVNSLCHLLKLLLVPENTPEGCSKEDYELYFAWAAVWAFGGALFKDQLVDWRDEFSKWWVTEFKSVKFPSQGTVFDYYIRTEDKKFASWGEIVPKFEFDPELPLQAALVPTAETVRVRFWMDMLIKAAVPVLLVGAPGTGKTALILNKLKSLDDEWVVAQASFNHYTVHHTMQAVLEAPLEKKAGRNYGPPGTKRLIYFVDDLNMPAVDAYGTASPHTVMRQHIDYNHWYDRQKHTMKVVSNTQYVCAMNPKAGSFTINPRLLRHFTVFALSSPSNEALQTIYRSLLGGHLSHNKFPTPLVKICDQLVDAAIKLHTKVASTFLPTAIRFHYIFNLRDLSNIFQGINFSSPEAIKAPMQLVRLWLHETDRVYSDKLIDEKDLETFQSLQSTIARESFPDLEADKLLEFPRIHCHFAAGMGDGKYQPIKDWPALSGILEESLNNYNEVNAVMGLVLFRDAMQHVCRINRILESPRGNALLVGVGGSGKQSLSRLAAFISNLETFQIQLAKGYGINELKVDLAKCFVKTGQKGVGVMFLMTDAQVADEKFLVLINDLLSSGQIPDLFPEDQRQEVIDGVRNEVKSLGMEDNNANCWEFFLDRVRRLLKVVLCFSPVGDSLRLRSRKFPGLVNCTTINWFHEWPLDALISVSKTFLEDTEFIPGDLKTPISEFMAFVHTSVNELSKVYLQNERRYNYTTPKSFLEQIKLYKGLLEKKAQQLQNNMDRMENGLTKLKSTAAQVDDLKEKLKAQEVELAQKNSEADALIERVGVETEKVNKEKEIAAVEEEKVRVITEDVSAKQKSCEQDLAKAEPALLAAQDALNTLNKTNLTELKSFGTPPPIVVTVTAAVMVLLAKGKVPKDRSWKAGKLMMGNVGEFLDSLITYDKENIPQENLVEVKKYLADPEFNPDFVRGKSLAAAGLCSWVCNIVIFYEVYCDVEPKRNALKEANAQLEAAQSKLAKIMEKIKKLDEALAKLTAEFQAATDAKLKCQREADATTLTISLANRLVGGLASEKVRWGDAVTRFKEQEKTLPGDVLLVSAFLSYTGCFSKRYREVLMNDKWLPFIHAQSKPIPITEGLDPLSLLTDSASIAKWQNEGLPADRVSTENATILTNAQRWPLIIDPQEQGIKWIKQREADLRVVRLGQKGYLDFIERAVSNGDCVLIENLGENIDPVLDNLLGRVTIKKGRAIVIGDKEVEYSPKFRLILHTKLGNPHYKPELQAQCTLINFTVTQLGLEDQLLADVVSAERPDLQVLKAKLTKEQNEYMITLKELEDALLARLSSAEGDFLRDVALVESLENTKSTAAEIEEKVKLAKNTEVEINTARENYRPAAARASLLYFIINELYKIHPMYQVSLKAFNVVFQRAIKVAEPDEDVAKRVLNIIDTITYNVFVYTTRGLFERDKLIFTAQMAFQILAMKKEIVPIELDFLLRCPSLPNNVSPVDFLSNALWGSVKSLSQMPGDAFQGLDRDIEGSAKRWKKFCESEVPEKEKFPGEWKNKTSMQRLCMLRCLRPDRMLYAIRLFVAEQLGERYTAGRQVEFAKSFEETSRSTGVFFILSPGVNPVLQVEELGRKLGYTADAGNYHQVSLGQGQEVVAEQALNVSSKEGHWVILENIHLVSKWLSALEKKMEECAADAHENFRFFLTAEPASSHASHIMPAGILQACIKITNEPPTGMQANIHAAMDEFGQETLEMCAREVEFKKIWFSLCYFHAVVIERRKFGPMGWNRNYPFNRGDLTISVNVLYNYLEANAVVPWTDLRYLFGEIMYGGHITDNLDRRLCSTYLQEYMKAEMLDGDLELAVGFNAPPPLDYAEYHSFIDESLPAESPYLYGMHPNAEIEFLTVTSAHLCNTVLELQPRDTGGKEGEAGQTREERLRTMIDEILEKLPDEFNMNEMGARCPPEERTPYTVVAFQECARMNRLTREIRRSLKELELGLKGELTITAAMESLSDAMFMNKVAPYWEKLAYPSTKPLAFWYADLLDRIKFLEAWSTDFNLPNAVWLGGLFNPQSFLTAIEQQTARKNEWPLDKMCLQCEVTKKYSRDDFPSPPREGSYVYGLYMEGARWDVQTGLIQECRLKELCPAMPVLFIKAIPLDKLDVRGTYDCPVFKTKERGRANEQVAVGVCPGFVWSLNLKTKVHPNKWILAGVAMLLSD